MIFALVDCNSFYVSCERLFKPHLKNKPVIVLSNNDGCTVSRSDEAKAIGIKMGEPYHQIKFVIRKNKIGVFSSNYALYGDISSRVMRLLGEWSPDIEVYSIDEAFLRLENCPTNNVEEYAARIRQAVLREVGIPTCVGLGPTKVLAKVANKIAKKSRNESGVFSLCDPNIREEALSIFPVGDIWGIGSKSAEKLNSYGIYTASQFRDADPALVQRLLTIVGHRIQEEMKGYSCLPLEEVAAKKQIISSRSFGRPVFKLEDLEEAISQYVTRAAEKLRQQNSVCQTITVIIHTNPYKQVRQYYSRPATVKLLTATNSTITLAQAGLKALKAIFKKGIEYKKAIVMLSDISPMSRIQFGLFEDPERYDKERQIMTAIDKINRSYYRDMIRIGSCGTDQSWKMASKLHSPHYTAKWEHLPIAKC